MKPQLHNSHLDRLHLCGESFRLAYLVGLKVAPTMPLVVGIATHAANADNLMRKAETGDLMPDEELRDTARDAFAHQWDGGVGIDADDERTLPEIRGDGIDRTVALAGAYSRHIAPRIRARVGHIERAFVVELDGYPWDLAGELDVSEPEEFVDDNGRRLRLPATIRDCKTSGKRPSPAVVAHSRQLTAYALAVQALDGALPDSVWLDFVVAGKRGEPWFGSYGSERGEDHIAQFWRTLERDAEVIEREVFTPSRPGVDWHCSEKWCGYARTNPDTGRPYCDFFTPRTVVHFGATAPNQRRTANVRSRKIEPGSAEYDAALFG